MEVLFINEYIFDERIAKEYMKYSFWRSPRLYIIVLMFLVIAPMLVYVEQYAYAAVFLAIFVIWILLSVRSFQNGVKKLLRKNAPAPEKDLNVTRFEFGEDCFVAHSPGFGAAVITYDELKRVSRMGETTVLILRGGTRYLLPNSGFKRGTAEEFLGFIKGKKKK